MKFKRLLCFVLFLLPILELQAAETMEVRTLLWQHSATEERLTIYWNGDVLRIEQPAKRFTLLYREKGEVFTGLEERDALYWHFNWPQLAKAVHAQKIESHTLKQNLFDDPASTTLGNAPATISDEPPIALVWKELEAQAPAHGETLWEGNEAPLGTIEARMRTKSSASEKAEKAFWQRFSHVADLTRLVALREIAPPDFQPVIASLPENAGNPIALTWNRGSDRETLTLLSSAVEANDPARFLPPPTFHETKLSAIEGMLEEAPAPPKPETDEPPMPPIRMNP